MQYQWHRSAGFVYGYVCIYFRFVFIEKRRCVQQKHKRYGTVKCFTFEALVLNGWHTICMNFIFISMSSYRTKQTILPYVVRQRERVRSSFIHKTASSHLYVLICLYNCGRYHLLVNKHNKTLLAVEDRAFCFQQNLCNSYDFFIVTENGKTRAQRVSKQSANYT